MTSIPEWADGRDCPVDGCDGEYYMDVGGSAIEPIAEYHSTCAHNINSCTGCGEMQKIVVAFSWPVHDVRAGSPGKTRVARFCEECDNPATIRKEIPEWVFEHGYVDPEVVER